MAECDPADDDSPEFDTGSTIIQLDGMDDSILDEIDDIDDSDNNCNNGEENKNQGTHISCLLYTSPSPRDRQKSRMPSSA